MEHLTPIPVPFACKRFTTSLTGFT